jgi:hypothetical protein
MEKDTGNGVLIGQLVLQWDNQLDNSVRAFNKLFDDTLHYDKDAEVTILEPYTHNGRLISINGGLPFQHLFFREVWYGNRKIPYVAYKRGERIGAWKNLKTAACDLDTTYTHLFNIYRKKRESHTLKIMIKKEEL